MTVPYNSILGLTAITQSGKPLGVVIGFEIDLESQTIDYYHVKAQNWMQRLWEDKLLIHRSQVISLSQEQLVVQDGVEKKKESSENVASVTVKEEAPLMTATRESEIE